MQRDFLAYEDQVIQEKNAYYQSFSEKYLYVQTEADR